MTHDASRSYTYDEENRLSAVDGGSTASYLYDPDGRRVQKVAGGVTTDYIRDQGGNVVAEISSTCNYCWTVDYNYLGGQLSSIYANSSTYFVHTDHLGSTRLLTGYPTASVLECDDYYPFGELVSCGGTSTTTHKFTGKERDSESNLDNFGARYYGSPMGRFMSPDPKPLSQKLLIDPEDLNLYVYTVDNPLRYYDPDGKDWRDAVADVVHVLDSVWVKGSVGYGVTAKVGIPGTPLKASVGVERKLTVQVGDNNVVKVSTSTEAGAKLTVPGITSVGQTHGEETNIVTVSPGATNVDTHEVVTATDSTSLGPVQADDKQIGLGLEGGTGITGGIGLGITTGGLNSVKAILGDLKAPPVGPPDPPKAPAPPKGDNPAAVAP